MSFTEMNKTKWPWDDIFFFLLAAFIALIVIIGALWGLAQLTGTAQAAPCGSSLGPGESCEVTIKLPIPKSVHFPSKDCFNIHKDSCEMYNDKDDTPYGNYIKHTNQCKKYAKWRCEGNE